MYELMQLSGQEYVDIYANKAKELIATYGTSTPTPEQLAAAEGGEPPA
jgi:1-acyl-sn-glycerol-3-phosphate acyltransferase